jgi:tRNA (guanine37-N1)-methyltransferase
MRVDILTIFPEMFGPVLGCSIPARAAAAGLVEYHVHDIRAWADGPHQKVDDRPFGGGPGMVMMCQPLYDAVNAIEALDERTATRILLSPQGAPLTQPRVEKLATCPRILLIAGRYEGIDERVIEELNPIEISIGDFVASGGELPAMLLTDALVRLIPGALGHEDSAAEDSFSRCADGRRLLEAPHYTRPRIWRDRQTPEVLLSGNHEAVASWRNDARQTRTVDRRPDLLNVDSSAHSPKDHN